MGVFHFSNIASLPCLSYVGIEQKDGSRLVSEYD